MKLASSYIYIYVTVEITSINYVQSVLQDIPSRERNFHGVNTTGDTYTRDRTRSKETAVPEKVCLQTHNNISAASLAYSRFSLCFYRHPLCPRPLPRPISRFNFTELGSTEKSENSSPRSVISRERDRFFLFFFVPSVSIDFIARFVRRLNSVRNGRENHQHTIEMT